jgi:ribosome maturation factor RimP
MINKIDIENICKTALTDSQFIVEVKVSRTNDVIVSVDDFEGLSIEECKRISRVIEAHFDREVEDYSLELGSPGLSNPFKVVEQYIKYLNKEVECITIDGEKTTGTLLVVEASHIVIGRTYTKKIENKRQTVNDETKINFSDIKSTRSVISFK